MPNDTVFTQLKRFGAEVRSHREKLGLSQEKFAERAGLSPQYVGRVELGKQAPGFEAMGKLARGCSARADTVKVWHLMARAGI